MHVVRDQHVGVVVAAVRHDLVAAAARSRRGCGRLRHDRRRRRRFGRLPAAAAAGKGEKDHDGEECLPHARIMTCRPVGAAKRSR